MAERMEGVFEHEKESFGTFLYNKNEKTVMGRTGSSWAKIGVFYLIFYAFLAGFFAVMMAIFYQTLDTNFTPTYTPSTKSGESGGSLLQSPALGFQPTPRKKNVESTLIWYRTSDVDDVKYWTSTLDKFIEPYEHGRNASGQHMVNCEQEAPNADDENDDRVCNFQDLSLGDTCQKKEQWGYEQNMPCVLLKLNKMINWKPDVYTSVKELPEEMPPQLKEHITNLTIANNDKVPKMVWVSCKGENPADMEYVGPIEYTPHQGFSSVYFPYKRTPEMVKKEEDGEKGYLSPLVAVRFISPQPYVLINVECRAWAKNIQHDKSNRLGLVHFELLIDA